MANCLLVGGGGFFGGHLTKRLLALGHKVDIVDCRRYSDSVLSGMAQEGHDYWPFDAADPATWHLDGGGDYWQQDVGHYSTWWPDAMSDLLRQADAVYMLAGLLGSVPCTENMWRAVQCNVLPMAVLIDALVKIDARPLVIHASSDLVYGFKQGPIREHERKDPMCAYAVTKLAAEELLAISGWAYHIDSVRLRISTTYGPYQQRASLINFYVSRALEDGELPVYGLGASKRDWLYIDDAVDALVLPLGNEYVRGAVNVPGDQWIIKALANKVVAVIGKGVVKSVKWPQLTANVDVAGHILDGNTIRSYGWDVNVELVEGIRYTAEWMKKQQCTK